MYKKSKIYYVLIYPINNQPAITIQSKPESRVFQHAIGLFIIMCGSFTHLEKEF